MLVIDKPAGMGSTDVVRVVRRAARDRRVGHTGTLDPDATGVLVVCVGRATRLVRFLQAGDKRYLAGAVFGLQTTTQDVSGETVAERSAAGLDEAAVRTALARFTGTIEQVPPMVSAVKIGGERLYRKARRGEEVERAARTVAVAEFALLGFEAGPRASASFAVTCSSGTYVRTLIHDLGQVLGCGASMTTLRRTRNGAFALDDAHPLDEVERGGADGTLGDLLLDARAALRGMPVVEVELAAALDAVNGRPLPARGASGPFAVVHGERLLGVFSDHGPVARAEAVLAGPADLAPPS